MVSELASKRFRVRTIAKMQCLNLNLCVLYLYKFIQVHHQLFKPSPKSDIGMSSRTLRNITLLASNSTNGLLDTILKSV